MTLALAGLVAGLVHVLSGPDHLAAIAPYAVTGKARAWRMGVRWGIGHGTGVLIVGVLALLLRQALPVAMLSAWSESSVGLVLVAIGIWGLRAARPGRARPHVHGRVAVAVGTLHGLAGSSHLLGILPALALPSDVAAGAYLLAFVAGSVCGMGAFSALLGSIADRGAAMQRALLALSSAVAIGVGCFWIFH